jgi:hypothetical protein
MATDQNTTEVLSLKSADSNEEHQTESGDSDWEDIPIVDGKLVLPDVSPASVNQQLATFVEVDSPLDLVHDLVPESVAVQEVETPAREELHPDEEDEANTVHDDEAEEEDDDAHTVNRGDDELDANHYPAYQEAFEGGDENGEEDEDTAVESDIEQPNPYSDPSQIDVVPEDEIVTEKEELVQESYTEGFRRWFSDNTAAPAKPRTPVSEEAEREEHADLRTDVVDGGYGIAEHKDAEETMSQSSVDVLASEAADVIAEPLEDEDAMTQPSADVLELMIRLGVLETVIDTIEQIPSKTPRDEAVTTASNNNPKPPAFKAPNTVFKSACSLVGAVLLGSTLLLGLDFTLLSARYMSAKGRSMMSCSSDSTKPTSDSFHVDHTLIQAWDREMKSCASSCCLGLFILAGDAPSHERAVMELIMKDRIVDDEDDAQFPQFTVWTSKQLIQELDGGLSSFNREDDDSALTKKRRHHHKRNKGKAAKPKHQVAVVFVKDADDGKLQTKHLEQLYKVGSRRCKHRQKHHHAKTPSVIVVLSTSFGSELLQSPDDVFSNRYMTESKTIKSDWLTVSQIVMNRHQILHGVKGNKPQRVCEEFFAMKQKAMHPMPMLHWFEDETMLGDWFLPIKQPMMSSLQLLFASPASPHMTEPSENEYGSIEERRLAKIVEIWLATHGKAVVHTDAAKKLLAKIATARFASTQAATKDHFLTQWLSSQYPTWTRNETCKAVLYKQNSRQIGSYNLLCR